MILHYRMTAADYKALYFLMNPKAVENSATQFMRTTVYWVILMVVGVVWGSDASLYLGGLFLMVLIYLVYHMVMYQRKFRKALEQAFQAQREKEIVLTVTDEGITEVADDVQSFAPWKAVVSYQHIDDRLFLLLKSDLWAIIPKSNVTQGAEYFEPLLERLVEKGIPARSQA